MHILSVPVIKVIFLSDKGLFCENLRECNDYDKYYENVNAIGTKNEIGLY